MRSLPTSPVSGGRQLPLRVRLTLWMLAIFLLVQLSIAFVFQLYQSRAIDEFYGQRLIARVDGLVGEVSPLLPGVTDEQVAALAEKQRAGGAGGTCDIDILDRSGGVVASSHATPARIKLESVRRAFATGSSVSSRLPDSSGAVRAAARSVRLPDGDEFLVVLTVDDSDASQVQYITARLILASIPIGILPIILSAYLIAGLAVRPLADIRELAQRLSPESIDQFIDSASAAQEVAAVRKELELARQRIEAGFATQERFMSNVSHELKTPIAVVLTEMQTLSQEGVPRPVKEFLRSTHEELEKLGRTVDNFLLLTRVRHGKGQIPALEHCYLRDILLDSYAGCMAMAALHSVRLNLRVPEGEEMDAAVMGNCDLLRIIFDNLIRNAIRFSPSGSIVEILASVHGANIEVVVQDSGPGIPAEALPRVFDRFAQAKDEERRGRGHGLGLEIALGIAELHGGNITVRNREQGGCEFTVTLPKNELRPPPRPDSGVSALPATSVGEVTGNNGHGPDHGRL